MAGYEALKDTRLEKPGWAYFWPQPYGQGSWVFRFPVPYRQMMIGFRFPTAQCQQEQFLKHKTLLHFSFDTAEEAQ